VIPNPPRKLGLEALQLALRERPRTLTFGAFGILIPVAQALVLWLFSTLAHNADDARIRAGGKAAQGEILRVEDAFGPTLNNVPPKNVTFRYKADGVEHEKSVTVNAPEVSGWKSGRPVAVLYLGDDAILTEIHPVEFPIPPGLMIASIVCWSLAVVAILAYGLAGARRKYLVLRHGEPREGKLLSFETWNMFPSSFPSGWFRASYTYVDSAGRERLGVSRSRDLTLANHKQKGDPLEILVLPADERLSTLLDSAAERALIRTRRAFARDPIPVRLANSMTGRGRQKFRHRQSRWPSRLRNHCDRPGPW
jgi:hypothetical protein